MCGPSSGWSKAALVVLIIGMSLHIAGWATNHWMTLDESNSGQEIDVGLWRQVVCSSSGDCEDTEVSSQYETDEFNAVRGLETITFCLVVFTVGLLFFFTCAEMDRRQTVAAVIMFLCYLAGTSSFIGMIVAITTTPDSFEVSWSLGLTVIAMTLILIAGTLMIPDSFEPYDEPADGDDEDDYFGTRNRTPATKRRPPASRSVTPISYRGGVEGNRWRSY